MTVEELFGQLSINTTEENIGWVIAMVLDNWWVTNDEVVQCACISLSFLSLKLCTISLKFLLLASRDASNQEMVWYIYDLSLNKNPLYWGCTETCKLVHYVSIKLRELFRKIGSVHIYCSFLIPNNSLQIHSWLTLIKSLRWFLNPSFFII